MKLIHLFGVSGQNPKLGADNYMDVLEMHPDLDSSKFFVKSTYQDNINRTKPCYLLTRKGCDMVANKMTGEKGILFTATYVFVLENAKLRSQVSTN